MAAKKLKNNPTLLEQAGVVHILLLIAAIGIIAFTLVSQTLPFRKSLALALQPNIVVIMTDDQNVDSLPVMRKLMSYPEGSWVKFNNATVNYSLCCPSRATFLSGQYSHVTGVTRNGLGYKLDDTNTLPVWLKNGGYRTGLIGKYLGGFPWDKGKGYIPPGWDYFTQAGTEGATKNAVDFINNNSASPFFLYLAYGSPHQPAQPLPQYANADVYIPPDSPNFNEADVSDKPSKIRSLPLLDQTKIDTWRAERLASQRDLLGVDDGVQTIVDTLKASGKLDNTMIIFLSDHGFSWGSHRWIGKVCPYEECSLFPLLIRYPGLSGNREENRLVSNVDFASTIAEYANVTPTIPQNGRSFISVITNTATNWDEAVLMESGGFFGVRVPGWKYTEYSGGGKELYDLTTDPYELENLAGKPDYSVKQAELAQRLQTLKGPIGTPSPTPAPAPLVSITNISNGAFIKGTKTVKIEVLDPEEAGVSRVELLVDQTVVGSTTTAPYAISWNTKTGTDGSHTLTAKWYDIVENVITSNPINVTVDNTLPIVSITSPAKDATVSGLVLISASASDSSGIKTVKFFVDSVLKTTLSSAPYQYSWDSTTVVSGNHTIVVKASDKAGNTGTSGSTPVTVQN